MGTEWLGSRRSRFAGSGRSERTVPGFPLPSDADGATDSAEAEIVRREQLADAIIRTREHLLDLQHPAGFWVGELEGDTILESEYVLLLEHLGQGRSERARKAAEYIRRQQRAAGGWAIFPGGPLEISASVKAYFALKLTGAAADDPDLLRARAAILAAGGAEAVNSFTRYYLALLGVLSYDQVPAVPPELVLLPKWMPFNIYEMSAWSRTIVVPLSILWAFRPQTPVDESRSIRELFRTAPEKVPLTMGPSSVVDRMSRRTWIDWNRVFGLVDAGLKRLERWRLLPLRDRAVRRAAEWMTERFADSDGLGAIFPPIVWSVVALRCLGHADDSPLVKQALGELEGLVIEEDDTVRLQPCKSPVWDTAIALLALHEAGVPGESPAIRKGVDWLVSKEVRHAGDWAGSHPGLEPGGWAFEFRNDFYPDVDDTSMVVMALARTLPRSLAADWRTELLLDDWSPHPADADTVAVVSGRIGAGTDDTDVAGELERLAPRLAAIRRGVRWVLGMQSADGGWGAFDSDNVRELFTRVPFADHNAMIDPSTADLTARMLEMFADVGVSPAHPALAKALEFVWQKQEPDACWFGRWGVNYLYGTWQALVGLTAIGVPHDDPRLRAASNWIKSRQNDDGGWGETAASYDDPTLRGQGPSTASQTAWALMGLLAAGDYRAPAARRGVEYLVATQNDDGTWDEEPFTGTGFPKVFYLKYHLYRIYFPLMALARYERLLGPA